MGFQQEELTFTLPIGLFYFLEKGTALTGTLALTRDESTSPEPT